MHVREKKRVGFQPAVSIEEKLNLGNLRDSSIVKQLSK